MSEVDLIAEVPPEYARLDSYEFTFYSPSLAGDLYTGPEETLEARTTIGAMTGLVNAIYRAQKSSSYARSWRGYNVGASAAMCNFENGQMGYLDGYNVKPEEGSIGLNLHAEQIAIAKGRLAGLNRVLAIAVYANPDNEDANPYANPTLRPCGRCVDMFKTTPEVDDRTLVMGANLDFSVCEMYTFGALRKAVVENGKYVHETLVNGPFRLQTEEDLEYYDRNIKTTLVLPIMSMYEGK